jgi:hypothetical protein
MLKLHPRSVRLRHLVAPAFILSLVVLALSGLVWKPAWWLLGGELLFYFGLAIFFGSRISERVEQLFMMPIVFLTIHLTWGASFLAGLIKTLRPRLAKAEAVASK